MGSGAWDASVYVADGADLASGNRHGGAAEGMGPCRGEGGAEPLLARYSSEVVPELTRRIEEGRLSMRAMIEELDVHYIERDEWAEVDPEGRSFININTPEDYARVIDDKERVSKLFRFPNSGGIEPLSIL